MNDVKKVKKSGDESANRGHKSRRKRKKNRGLYYVLMALIVVSCLVVLSFTVFFNIKTIEVIGESEYTTEQIIASSGLRIGNNLLTLNIKKNSDHIKSQLKNIDSVVIKKQLPDKLIIEVTKAEPELCIMSNGQYVTLSKNYKVMSISAENVHSVVELQGVDIEAVAEGQYLDSSKAEWKELFESIRASFTQYEVPSLTAIDIGNTNDLKVVYDGRVLVKLGSQASLNYKIHSVSKVLQIEAANGERGTINATVAGVATFKAEL